ncbi:Hyaluronan and proteoglycan link protein 1 [Bagarius yarrelli]|uniref:Hyaluronan and proteoglycan link protein 1 n=1 Tax=Bagarius yarrelli TaxID=175774 RepID=A0A556VC90_BAGYA|nr:Hyaluronan and proteoglycan link protein 1 [Bagarius yarrelli]
MTFRFGMVDLLPVPDPTKVIKDLISYGLKHSADLQSKKNHMEKENQGLKKKLDDITAECKKGDEVQKEKEVATEKLENDDYLNTTDEEGDGEPEIQKPSTEALANNPMDNIQTDIADVAPSRKRRIRGFQPSESQTKRPPPEQRQNLSELTALMQYIKMNAALCLLIFLFTCHAENFDKPHDLAPHRMVYISENGPGLSVMTEQAKVVSHRGGNATLPCTFQRKPGVIPNPKMRMKWTKLTSDYLKEIDVFVAMGFNKKSYGKFHGRVRLRGASENDASLIISEITLEDYGKYKCEVIDGLEDGTAVVSLNLQGVVFPYFSPHGRYNLNFQDAEKACQDQDAIVASFDQLYDAWRDGLDWCNAGWLSDGSVQYPVVTPREPCGGKNTVPGIRNYGMQDKKKGRFDVFCFTSNFKGRFYYLKPSSKMTYDEAVLACQKDGAQIAKVGQMYSAWKLLGYDRCDAGWLADGSVRYPISRPRRRCSPTEAAVRFSGFPNKKHKLYGVYCFKG